MQGPVFLGGTSSKLGLMCLAQRHNAATPVRLEPAALRFRDKHSTTEQLCSLPLIYITGFIQASMSKIQGLFKEF